MYSLQRHTLRRLHVKRPLTPSSVYSGRSSAPPTTLSPPPPPRRCHTVRGRTRRHRMMVMGGGGGEWVAFLYSRPWRTWRLLRCEHILHTHTHTHTPVRVYLQEDRKVAAAEDCVAEATDFGCGARCGPNHARLLLLRARRRVLISQALAKMPSPPVWSGDRRKIGFSLRPRPPSIYT